jgi:hypothetical protein
MNKVWHEVRRYVQPYKEWREVVSEIHTERYNDAYGQDPTSKLGEQYWENLYKLGLTPEETINPKEHIDNEVCMDSRSP